MYFFLKLNKYKPSNHLNVILLMTRTVITVTIHCKVQLLSVDYSQKQQFSKFDSASLIASLTTMFPRSQLTVLYLVKQR